jgi:hypothetical protein
MDQSGFQQQSNPAASGPAEPAFSPPANFMAPPAGFGMNDTPTPPPVVDDAVTTPAPTDNTSPSSVIADSDDLIGIKQDALAKLAPLVEHLEQSPEEKFRTTMMLIQATDDETKIKDAYAAAQAITDKKAQAQALLDVVNEINYFTQQKQG